LLASPTTITLVLSMLRCVRGKALNVCGFDRLHAADELIDLIEVHAIDCQRTYLRDQAPGLFPGRVQSRRSSLPCA